MEGGGRRRDADRTDMFMVAQSKAVAASAQRGGDGRMAHADDGLCNALTNAPWDTSSAQCSQAQAATQGAMTATLCSYLLADTQWLAEQWLVIQGAGLRALIIYRYCSNVVTNML